MNTLKQTCVFKLKKTLVHIKNQENILISHLNFFLSWMRKSFKIRLTATQDGPHLKFVNYSRMSILIIHQSTHLNIKILNYNFRFYMLCFIEASKNATQDFDTDI